eukprot:3733135-Pyramimonas_sp.AAC.1
MSTFSLEPTTGGQLSAMPPTLKMGPTLGQILDSEFPASSQAPAFLRRPLNPHSPPHACPIFFSSFG